jgi:radical SAM protein with 4Fe4S-binding SPASM domain
LKKLASPLRLTWDWAWPPIAHPGAATRRTILEQARAIGAEIVRARVLLLEVGYPGAQDLLGGDLAAALAGFEGELSLVLAPESAAEIAGAVSAIAPVPARIWLDATPVPGRPPADLRGWPAVRWYLTAANLDQVAAGIEHALACGVTAVSLPNLPLFGDVLRRAADMTPDAGQLEAFALRIATALRDRPGTDLRVHHYGLWQRLRAAGVRPRGEEEPGAGCQAGAALGYVDPAGVLYPCASLPVPLARLGSGPGTIAAAWASPELAALRERISRLPERCAGCPCEPACRGGCRGWAQYLAADWGATGPDCAKP